MTWRIGVDSGGTFTDICLFDDTSGRVEVWKVPSTPDDPSRGIAGGVAEGVGRVDAGTQDACGDGPVHSAGIQVTRTQPSCHRFGDSRFTGTRRPVEGNDFREDRRRHDRRRYPVTPARAPRPGRSRPGRPVRRRRDVPHEPERCVDPRPWLLGQVGAQRGRSAQVHVVNAAARRVGLDMGEQT